MNISQKQIKTKKTIGYLNNIPVDLLVTYGGLRIIIMIKDKKSEIIGVGPHEAIAKFSAENKYKNIKWI